LFVLVAISLSCVQAKKTINWKGYNWTVRDTGSSKQGPGGNYWKEGNVEVTNDDKLIMYIRKSGNIFSCSEVICKSNLGYGTYGWDFSESVESVVDKDINVVLGLFLYKSDEEEIDIEWARWGDDAPDANNMDYVSQPYTAKSGLTFRLESGHSHTRHQFTYKNDSIVFKAIDLDDHNKVIFQWSTTENIPTPEDLPIHINFWQMSGIKPVSNMNITIDNFFYYEKAPDPTPTSVVGSLVSCGFVNVCSFLIMFLSVLVLSITL